MLPSELVQYVVYLKGKPISLSGRNYLLPIYDGGYKHIILRSGRQCEKSTTLCNKMVLNSITTPGFNNLYITCTKPQAKDFSDLKLDPILDSPPIQDYWIGRKLKFRQNVYFKKFINHSTIKLRYAMTRKQIYQGLSADMNAIDEIQDIPSDTIPLINETLSHSNYHYRIYAGTPKGEDNTLDYWWSKSTRNEYFIKCQHCNRWNYLDLKNIGKDGLICRYCGKRIYPKDGMWVRTGSPSRIEGFRVSQLIVPWKQSPDSWADLLLTMENYSEQDVYNLILALSYGVGVKPVTEMQLAELSRVTWMDTPDPDVLRYPIFIGIDWGTNLPGKADTILAVMVAVSPTDYRYIYFKRYHGVEWADSTVMMTDIIKQCRTFHGLIIAADWGYGATKNDILRNAFGWDNVWVMFESTALHSKIRWNQEAHFYTIGKTLALDDFFHDIQKAKIFFPIWNKFRPFAKDILSEHIEVNSRTRQMYYDHDPSAPDDTLHACLFAKVAADKYFGKI